MTRKETIALLLALLACLIWSGNFVIARGVHDLIPPVTLSFWRWVVASAVILPIGYKHVREEWPAIRQHWKYLASMGVFGIALFGVLIYIAAGYTSAHHIALISATSPIWTLFMVGLLGIENLSRYKIGGAVCALCGALVVISHGRLDMVFSQGWNEGDILLVISSLIWAVYCVMLHYKPKEINQISFLTVIIVIGTLTLLPFYLWEAAYVAPTPFTPEAWAVYLYVGVGSSVVAWFAWNYCVHTIGSVKTGLVYYTLPIFCSVLSVIFLGEPGKPYHAIGFMFVFLGIFISNLRKLELVRQV